ncbi:UNVERIFIED_CONTAM: hypothetical protein Slati_2768100 [Sesamum latifolium]|uniref:Reverse transcriptase n=1 Tax=Sesamum latifolium TaxID=2727402 RepID=A0AAW2VYB0_9LAMI
MAVSLAPLPYQEGSVKETLYPLIYFYCARNLLVHSYRMQTNREKSKESPSASERRAYRTSYLDDIRIYCQATHSSIISVKNIMESYARASSQMINYNKSSMILSKNSADALKNTLPALLGLQREDQQERYLGLPSVVGHSKKGVFSYIRDRVWQRIQGWYEKNLSQAGKAVYNQSYKPYPCSR